MLQLKNINKRFGSKTVAQDINLNVEAGEILAVLGRSGCGKSTLLRLINLLERPDTGIVSVCGQELTALNATQLRHARQNIGMVFQQFNLLSNRTVAENVAFPLEIAKWPSKKNPSAC